MTNETDNFNAWKSAEKQIDDALKVGLLTRDKARDVYREAKVSYANRAMLKQIELFNRMKK
uniref:Uncharacterized protein n=1 Tax=viral metagenome TaxID=1070528 RepID=A0A6M3MGZ4_9ZZZZ